jgi:hypothetical protein
LPRPPETIKVIAEYATPNLSLLESKKIISAAKITAVNTDKTAVYLPKEPKAAPVFSRYES